MSASREDWQVNSEPKKNEEDWQVKLKRIEERSSRLFETGQWSDCEFIVGQDPHQEVFKGHKLLLAMSSPVFEAMFYGSMPEKNDPIQIKDVQPKAFKALLQHIYTNEVDLSSFDLACEVCYCAKKYMFPFLVQHCTRYMWSDLCPKNVCRALEFSNLFEEYQLRDQCLALIQKQTQKILCYPSFCDIELDTLLTILDQDTLYINSELDLFRAVEDWSKAECIRKQLDPNDRKSLRSVLGNALFKIRFLTLSPKEFAEGPGQSPLLTQEESFAILMNISSSAKTVQMPKDFDTTENSRNISFVKFQNSLFTKLLNRPARCNVRIDPGQWTNVNEFHSAKHLVGGCMFSLSQNAATKDCEKTTLEEIRALEREMCNEPHSNSEVYFGPTHRYCTPSGPKEFCTRGVNERTDIINHDMLFSSLSFTVNKNICIVGIVVPTQLRKNISNSNFSNSLYPEDQYTEVVYAYLLDSYGSRLTYTYFTSKVKTGSMMEISFNRAIYIQKHKYYRVEVVFNKPGCYPLATCGEAKMADSVYFVFKGQSREENVRDGLIRSIVFMLNPSN